MAHLVLVIDTDDSIAELNARIASKSAPKEGTHALLNYLSAINGGSKPADIQVTTRDTDPSVSTSGTGSTQVEFNHK